MLTETDVDPLPVPELGETPSQAPPDEMPTVAVQLNAPPPELEMVMLWLDGFVPPCAAAKARVDGVSEITGALAVMVKLWATESPPPGPGLNTVTWAVPAVAMSLAKTEAFNWLLVTKVVARSLPLQRTTELEMKFEPLAFKVNPGPPTMALLGDTVENDGTGLPACITMRSAWAIPFSVAVIRAVIWVATTDVATSKVPPPLNPPLIGM